MRALAILLGIGIVALAWLLLFAPARYGGQTQLVVIDGASMEPRFHTGDLVITRESSHYTPGEIVTYDHPVLGTVFHRIVAIDGDNFSLQGDNNNSRDSYQPSTGEISGELWVHIPGAGTYLELARNPAVMTTAFASIGLLIMLPQRSRSRSRKGKKLPHTVPSLFDATGKDLLGLFVVVAIGASFLAIVAFSSDTEVSKMNEYPYEQHGRFDYAASAPDGIYDRPGVISGEPIFRNLTSAFDIQFDYSLDSNSPVAITGVSSLTAEIQSQNGWQRTFELAPVSEFDGNKVSVGGSINLNDLQKVIGRMEAESGVEVRSYLLQVQAIVSTEGTVAGQDISESFSPVLRFQLDDLQLQLDQSPTDHGEALSPGAGGSVMQATTIPGFISIGPLEINTSTARMISLVVGAISLLLIALLAFRTLQDMQQAGPRRAIRGFEDRIVNLEHDGSWSFQEFAEIVAIDDFRRLASLTEGPIYHHADQYGDSYVLQVDGEHFRFTIPAGSDDRQSSPAEAERSEHAESGFDHTDLSPARSDNQL